MPVTRLLPWLLVVAMTTSSSQLWHLNPPVWAGKAGDVKTKEPSSPPMASRLRPTVTIHPCSILQVKGRKRGGLEEGWLGMQSPWSSHPWAFKCGARPPADPALAWQLARPSALTCFPHLRVLTLVWTVGAQDEVPPAVNPEALQTR